nr:hypothetical protein [Oscillospiraceae bacterium]
MEGKRLFKKDRIVDVDIGELEKEGNNRLESVGRKMAVVLGTIGIAWTLFQIYTGFFGLLPAVLQRATTMGFALVLTFLGFRAGKKHGKKDGIPFYDWILAALSVAVVAYLFINYRDLVMRGGSPLTMDIVMGCVAILLVIEAARRAVGLPLVIVAA